MCTGRRSAWPWFHPFTRTLNIRSWSSSSVLATWGRFGRLGHSSLSCTCAPGMNDWQPHAATAVSARVHCVSEGRLSHRLTLNCSWQYLQWTCVLDVLACPVRFTHEPCAADFDSDRGRSTTAGACVVTPCAASPPLRDGPLLPVWLASVSTAAPTFRSYRSWSSVLHRRNTFSMTTKYRSCVYSFSLVQPKNLAISVSGCRRRCFS